MADCGQFEYQLIEQIGARALSTAQLLRAEINSIDRAANTADITLLDQCDATAGIDLSAVKIWYHCEFSTGTIEDLAMGHLAFNDGDIVYLVFNPAFGEVSSILYIVGHVDIHGTNRCLRPEYVVIKLGYDLINPYGVVTTPQGYWVTIYDAATGATLDLEAFTPLTDSPTQPSAFPCIVDSAFEAWLSYNFDIALSAHSCPMSIIKYDNTKTVTETITDDDSDCDYHSKTGYSDGGYRERYCHADWSNLVGNKYQRVDATIDNHDVIPSGRYGWAIYDEVAKTTRHVFIATTIIFEGSAGATGSGLIYSDVSIDYSIAYNSDIYESPVVKKTYNVDAQYGPGFIDIEYPVFNGVRGAAYTVGALGLYVICNCYDEYIAQAVLNAGNFIGGHVGWPCVDSGIGYGILFYLPWEHSIGNTSIYHTYGLSVCFSCSFDDIPEAQDYTLSPTLCMQHADSAKSRGLEDTFAELKKSVYALGLNARSWSGSPPQMSVFNKRAGV